MKAPEVIVVNACPTIIAHALTMILVQACTMIIVPMIIASVPYPAGLTFDKTEAEGSKLVAREEPGPSPMSQSGSPIYPLK